MHPFVKRNGGKFYARNEILPYFSKEINTYIEPFLGGGSIFLALERSGIKVKSGCYLNDLSNKIIEIWQIFFEQTELEKFNLLWNQNILYAEGTFEYLLDFNPRNNIESAFKTLALTMLSYSGKSEAYYIGIGDINRKMNKCYTASEFYAEYHEYLKRMNVKLSRKDFSVFFKGLFNRKESFIYADPPYVGTSGYDDEGLEFPMERQADLCRYVHTFKGKVALSLNDDDDGWVRQNYNDLKMVKIQTRWAGNVKSDMNKQKIEFLIMNYESDQDA